MHTVVIHDRSGSMAGTWKENLNGFGVLVADLKKNKEVDYFLSLTVFDTVTDRPLIAVPIAKVDASILASYPPRGGTALYDALGASVADDNDFDKVVFVIITDGEENSSMSFTKESMHTLIDAKLQAGKSSFVYLGSQPETWDDARAMGLNAGSTVMYNTHNIGSTYTVVADALHNFASASARSSRSFMGTYASTNLMHEAAMKVGKDDPIVTATSMP